MRNDLTPEQLKQPIAVTLPLGVILGLSGAPGTVINISGAARSALGSLPEIGAPLENGIYAGLSLHAEQPLALVLLPGELDSTKWNDAVAWAEKQGGALPSRIDQLVLFKNLKGEFKDAYYWSGEEYAPDPDCAWYQGFADGYQYAYRKDYYYRARAVRRVVIK